MQLLAKRKRIPILFLADAEQTENLLRLVMRDRNDTVLKKTLKAYFADLSRISFETENADIAPVLKNLPPFRVKSVENLAYDFSFVICNVNGKPLEANFSQDITNLIHYLSKERHNKARLVDDNRPKQGLEQTTPKSVMS